MPRVARTSIDCPHCQEPLRVRSSRITSITSKQMYMQCTNLECGGTYTAVFEILNIIAPSATPNPDVFLRSAPPRSKPLPANDVADQADAPLRQLVANDNGAFGASTLAGPEVPASVANDDDELGEAVATGG